MKPIKIMLALAATCVCAMAHPADYETKANDALIKLCCDVAKRSHDADSLRQATAKAKAGLAEADRQWEEICDHYISSGSDAETLQALLAETDTANTQLRERLDAAIAKAGTAPTKPTAPTAPTNPTTATPPQKADPIDNGDPKKPTPPKDEDEKTIDLDGKDIDGLLKRKEI